MDIKDHFDAVCARFSQIYWHDSKLLEMHLLKDEESRHYDLRLDLNLIIDYKEKRRVYEPRSVIFKECRIIRSDLDLLGVLFCGGDISSAVCHKDAVQLERAQRNKVQEFDLPQKQNPLNECMGFQIEMIHPGGEILIFARDFILV